MGVGWVANQDAFLQVPGIKKKVTSEGRQLGVPSVLVLFQTTREPERYSAIHSISTYHSTSACLQSCSYLSV